MIRYYILIKQLKFKYRLCTYLKSSHSYKTEESKIWLIKYPVQQISLHLWTKNVLMFHQLRTQAEESCELATRGPVRNIDGCRPHAHNIRAR